MIRFARAALAATLSILLVAGGSLALTQATDDAVATLQAAPWTLTELDGEAVPASAGIAAVFGSDGSLSGFAGCNGFSGTYELDGALMTVSQLAATRIGCADDVMAMEDTFLDLLQATAAWAISGPALALATADERTLVFGGASEPAPFTGTAWTLVSIFGDDVTDYGATATFTDESTVGGFAGCNDYNGGYTLDGDAITIGPLAATRKACDDAVMALEDAFLRQMEAATTRSLSGDTLTLSDPDGSVDLVFSAGGGAPSGTLVGAWDLVDLDGESVPADAGLSATFDEAGAITGFGGCNDLFGSYSVDGDVLTIEGLASTRISCDPDIMDREGLYIEILGAATSWEATADELTLTASDGAVLTFTAGAGPAQPTPAPSAGPSAEPTGGVASGDLVGPTWQLTSLNGTPIPAAIVSVTITFAADGTLTGNGGCNDFEGTWSLDGTALTLTAAQTTQEVCGTMVDQIEQGLLPVLGFFDTAEVVDGELHLDSSFGIQTVWLPL